jgi:hypothetical protein
MFMCSICSGGAFLTPFLVVIKCRGVRPGQVGPDPARPAEGQAVCPEFRRSAGLRNGLRS